MQRIAQAGLPLVAPGIGAFVVLCVLFAWNDFLFAAIIGSGGAKTLPVATRELVQPQNIQWGTIRAAGVVPSERGGVIDECQPIVRISFNASAIAWQRAGAPRRTSSSRTASS